MLAKYLFLIQCYLIENNLSSQKIEKITFNLAVGFYPNEKSHWNKISMAIKNCIVGFTKDSRENIGIIVCEYAKIKALPAEMVFNQLLYHVKQVADNNDFGKQVERDLSFFSVRELDTEATKIFINLHGKKEDLRKEKLDGPVLIVEKEAAKSQKNKKSESYYLQEKEITRNKKVADEFLTKKKGFWVECRNFITEYDGDLEEKFKTLHARVAKFEILGEPLPDGTEGLNTVILILFGLLGARMVYHVYSNPNKPLGNESFYQTSVSSLLLFLYFFSDKIRNFIYTKAVNQQLERAAVARDKVESIFADLYRIEITAEEVSPQLQITAPASIRLLPQANEALYQHYFSQKIQKPKKPKISSSDFTIYAEQKINQPETKIKEYNVFGRRIKNTDLSIKEVVGLNALLVVDKESLIDQLPKKDSGLGLKNLMGIAKYPVYVPPDFSSGVVKLGKAVVVAVTIKDGEQSFSEDKCFFYKIKKLGYVQRIALVTLEIPETSTILLVGTTLIEDHELSREKKYKVEIDLEKVLGKRPALSDNNNDGIHTYEPG